MRKWSPSSARMKPSLGASCAICASHSSGHWDHLDGDVLVAILLAARARNVRVSRVNPLQTFLRPTSLQRHAWALRSCGKHFTPQCLADILEEYCRRICCTNECGSHWVHRKACEQAQRLRSLQCSCTLARTSGTSEQQAVATWARHSASKADTPRDGWQAAPARADKHALRTAGRVHPPAGCL